MCQLWSHFNPTVEKRWQRALPLQRLWLVVTITTTIIFTLFHTNPTTSAMLVVGCHNYHHHWLSLLPPPSFYLSFTQILLPLQCLRLVGTIAIFTLFQNISHQLLFCLWLVVTIIVSPPYFSVSFTFSQIKSQCLRPLLQNERDKSTSSEAKEAPGEF